ncbi:MAG: class I SAM-dependent methyltransferase [Vulcanimicrobiaceae bacterium]
MALEAVLTRIGFPAMQNVVYADRTGARSAPRGDMRMMVCASCGFVFNGAFDGSLVAYAPGYDNAIPVSAAFHEHLSGRADVALQDMAPNARVADIGCGNGAFLRVLSARHRGVVGFGIDAAYVGPERFGDIRFERRFFGGADEQLEVDVLTCRHVIEHVPDPVAFLCSIRAGLARSRRARVYFETPSFEWILEQGAIWDVFYEHCNYFTAAALRYAFHRAGFTVTRIERVFDGQYFWVEATLADVLDECRLTSTEDTGKVLEAVRRFAEHEESACAALRGRLESSRVDGPVVLWGAAAKGVTLANLVDPDASLIIGIIDRNVAKQGRYVAVTGHEILAPRALVDRSVAWALVVNPLYAAENAAEAAELNASTRVEALH